MRELIATALISLIVALQGGEVLAHPEKTSYRLMPPTIKQTLQEGSGKYQIIPCLLDINSAWVIAGKQEPFFHKGLLLLYEGDWNAAAKLFHKAAVLSPKNALLLEYQGLALYMQGTFADQNPSTDRGLENINRKLIKEATVCFDRAVQLQPECGLLYRNLGLATNLFDRNRALYCLRRAVSLAPKEPRCLLALGGSLSHRGEFREALNLFERGLALCPDSEQFLFNKANTLLSSGRYKESLKYYDRLLQLEPGYEIGFYERGIARAGLGLNKQAMADFDRAVAINKVYADAYDYRALVRGASGDYEGSIRDDKKAIQCDPTAAHFYSNIALSLLRLGRYKEALKAVDTAIDLGERIPGTLVCKGLILASMGQLDEALKNADLALQMEPKCIRALQLRGRLFEKKGDFEQAVVDYDDAKKLLVKEQVNGRPAALQAHGLVLHKINDQVREEAEKAALAGLSKSEGGVGKKQIEETLRAYTKLITMNPEKPDLYYERATVYMIGNAYSSALKDFDSFASFRPQGESRTTAALLANVCLQQLHKPAEGRELLLKESHFTAKRIFLRSLVQFSLGNLSDTQLLAAAQNESDRSYSFFYIAMKYREVGNFVKAKEFLSKLLSTNMYEMNEYQIGLNMWSKMRRK